MMEAGKRKGRAPVVVKYEFPENEVPKSYSEMVINIIKYIACQKQIPYSYQHLNFLATREESHGEGPLKVSSKRARVLNKARETFEAMEKLFQHLGAELESCKSGEVEEVMVLLGATPFSAKEAYRIQLPPLAANEGLSSVKNVSLRFVRHLIECEEFQDLILKPLSPTNVYVFVKKLAGRRSEWLLPKDEYRIPLNCLQAVFSFSHSQPPRTFPIYNDGSSTPDSERPMMWYQSRIMFKGFKNHTDKLPVLASSSLRGPCMSKQLN